MHAPNAKIVQRTSNQRPKKRESFAHKGCRYALNWQSGAWRARSRSKSHPFDFWTGLANKADAISRAREEIDNRPENPILSRKGGGNLEALAAVYLTLPKRCQQDSAEINISRLRTVCRTALGRELAAVTCREVSQRLWESYQRAALEKAGRAFNYATRYRENIAINSCIRAARSLFIKTLLVRYREEGLDVTDGAGLCQMLPEPVVPQPAVDDAALVADWRKLTGPLWEIIGLARFAGLRREEICDAQTHWIEVVDGVVTIAMRDRPEESWWTKTGKPYRTEVIDRDVAAWLLRRRKHQGHIVVVNDAESRHRWFEREPQRWLREHGITAPKPLHRLRGLYADHVARITRNAVAARLAGVRAAQKNLGHTTSRTTERHYLT